MRKSDAVCVFDQHVSGTGNHYSLPDMNSFLGLFDKYAFQLNASTSSGAANVTMQLEHGSDQSYWTNKNGTAEINAQALDTANPKNLLGQDLGTVMGQAYGRLRVSLSAAVNCRIRIYAVGRDT